MSRGVNLAIILGNVGKKDQSEKVTRLSVATNEKWKDKNSGEMIQNTEWHRIVFFGKLADIVNQYVDVGSQLYVEGRIQTTKYQGNDGIERWSTDIIANKMQLLGKSDGSSERQPAPPAESYAADAEKYKNKEYGDLDDDIPF